MANQHAVSADAQVDADFAEHVKTYRMFLNLLKIALACVVVALVTLAITTL